MNGLKTYLKNLRKSFHKSKNEKNILILFLTLLFTNLVYASDEKPGRFFEDQPKELTKHFYWFLNQILLFDVL